MANPPQTKLMELLAPVLTKVAELDPASRTEPSQVTELEQALEAEFPWSGERVQSIGEEIAQGIEDGWLCDRGPKEARFSRVAKPSPGTHQLSVDVVSMVGDAVDHTHPQGEVTIGFSAGGEGENVTFEHRPASWVFLPPGSRHVPHVEGGRMNLIYFLPDGAVEWHFDKSP